MHTALQIAVTDKYYYSCSCSGHSWYFTKTDVTSMTGTRRRESETKVCYPTLTGTAALSLLPAQESCYYWKTHLQLELKVTSEHNRCPHGPEPSMNTYTPGAYARVLHTYKHPRSQCLHTQHRTEHEHAYTQNRPCSHTIPSEHNTVTTLTPNKGADLLELKYIPIKTPDRQIRLRPKTQPPHNQHGQTYLTPNNSTQTL